jgi:ELWxxDGT repeat protein
MGLSLRRPVRYFRPLLVEALEDRSLLAVQVVGPIVDVGGIAYYAGDDGIHGRELWKSDGTLSGTSLVKDIRAGAGSGWLLTNVSNLFSGHWGRCRRLRTVEERRHCGRHITGQRHSRRASISPAC